MIRGQGVKRLYDKRIKYLLDTNKTIEDNIKEFRAEGYKITKKRLIQYLNEYNISLSSDRELKYQKVIDIYNENPLLSSRALERVCKDNGIKITFRSIQLIINKLNAKSDEERNTEIH